MAVPPVIFGGNEPSICQNLLFIKEIFKGSSELASFAPHALKGQKLLELLGLQHVLEPHAKVQLYYFSINVSRLILGITSVSG